MSRRGDTSSPVTCRGHALVVVGLVGGVEVPADGFAQHLRCGKAGLGDAAFAAAWTEGRAMALEQAIKYALAES